MYHTTKLSKSFRCKFTSGFAYLHGVVEGTGNHFALLSGSQAHKVDGVTTDTDGQLGVVLRVGHGIFECLAVQHIHVQVVCTLLKVSVKKCAQVLQTILGSLTQRSGDNRERVANTVQAGVIGKLGNGVKGCKGTLRVAAVHGVGTGGKSLTLNAAVGGGASLAAVDDIGGDGENGEGVLGIAVGGVLLELVGELLHNFTGNGVHTEIIVAVLGEVSLDVKCGSDSGFGVAHGCNLCVLDSRERVGNDRETSDTKSHETVDVGIVQGHLDALVAILVVHVVDAVHGVDVQLRHPIHSRVVVLHHLVVLERAVGGCNELGPNLLAGNLVLAAVHRVKKKLGKVAACTKELHLLAHSHTGDTAGNAVVRAVVFAHLVVVLILHRGGVDAGLGAELFEPLGKVLGPQNGDVGLRGGPEVVEGLKETEGGLGDQWAPAGVGAGKGEGHPGRISGKQVVVFRSAQVAHKTQLDNKVVNHLLRLRLCQPPFLQVLLNVGVEEGVDAADGHCCTVLLLDGCKIAKVEPLDGLACVLGRTSKVETAVDLA
eukprot:comp20802_c0_seq2/m.27381 comp20802_c0_seq2/g.27381  ORF comp20802_c0_seq2/g.27381 comp20802_c0_seq2/m.27381 type:complete len:542 (+) comp20802_c0_seq2:380-2005(+)